MALSILIVDDEPLARQELEYLLQAADDVTIVGQGTNGIEAVSLIESLQPDLVFLDVQMPGLDGFAVLKKLLHRKLPLPEVVFATAYDQYAVRAFEVNAVDYLLKPFNEKRVLQTLEKARARRNPSTDTAPGGATFLPEQGTEAKLDALLRLVGQQTQAVRHPASQPAPSRGGQSSHTGKVVVRAASRLLLVDQREICFASIEGGAISVVTPTVEGLSNCRTLEDLMDLLDPNAFWRAHRSFVVNLQHIREVVPWFKSSYQLRMDDPKRTEIPVSRSQTKRLRELFNL